MVRHAGPFSYVLVPLHSVRSNRHIAGQICKSHSKPGRLDSDKTYSPTSAFALPGWEEDARVEQIAFHLAVARKMRCTTLKPNYALVLQHLSQFEQVERSGMIAKHSLNQGPGLIVVVTDSPAAAAGIHPGDVLLGINGRALPPETALSVPFAAARVHARADAIRDLWVDAGGRDFAILLLRNDRVSSVNVPPPVRLPVGYAPRTIEPAQCPCGRTPRISNDRSAVAPSE